MANVREIPLTLEARLARLESIVELLEGEDLELEEALRYFEEGIGHIRLTREILEATELRVEKLLQEGADAADLGVEPLRPGSPTDD